ncbi:hypothetical protein GOBAR_DD12830 [Gossypium barbadense]|nr:hypothetical protein GOBAR_DD12830 [Gossypium barbadense]
MEPRGACRSNRSSFEKWVAIVLTFLAVVSPLYVNQKPTELELEEQSMDFTSWLCLLFVLLLLAFAFWLYLNQSFTRFDRHWIRPSSVRMPVEVEFLTTGSDSLKNTSHETSVSVNVLETKVLCFIVAALQLCTVFIIPVTGLCTTKPSSILDYIGRMIQDKFHEAPQKQHRIGAYQGAKHNNIHHSKWEREKPTPL